MKELFASRQNASLISEAEKLINGFFDKTGEVVYVINPDGSTFTLEPGCMLLNATVF